MQVSTIYQQISCVYSPADAERFDSFTLTEQDKEHICEVARRVLAVFPDGGLYCAPMTASWVGRISRRIPAYVVAGSLSIDGRVAFAAEETAADIQQKFVSGDAAWDGHCWAAFPGMFGDVSIMRTAKDPATAEWVRSSLLSRFPSTAGLVCNSPAGFADDGLEYGAVTVLPERSLAGLDSFARQVVLNEAGPSSLHSRHKIGRNEPCPCGSGKKYKRCCG